MITGVSIVIILLSDLFNLDIESLSEKVLDNLKRLILKFKNK